jgi:hypothetical protein
MTTDDFVHALDERNRAHLERLAAGSAAGEPAPELSVAALLKLALRNEMEAAHVAAAWMSDTSELDAKLALARQCGDEAKHYRWIEERLAALGVDLAGFDPLAGGLSPLSRYLLSLQSTVERAAAGQFTREALAVARNDVFADFCDARGDALTAALYRERIQPDERHHHELGRRLLERYAGSEAAQASASAAAARTLEIAEEIQELVRLRGLTRAPGC